MKKTALLAAVAFVVGCGGSGVGRGANLDPADASASAPAADAGPEADAGPMADAGADAGSDAGALDAGTPDAGTDGGVTTTGPDAGAPGPQVRVLYLVPSDVEQNPAYPAAIAAAITSVQGFYKDQMDGTTFHFASATAETCVLPGTAEFYGTGSWNKVLADVQGCEPVAAFGTETLWIVYADVPDVPCGDPGRLGASLPGLSMFPRSDLLGLTGHTVMTDTCGNTFSEPVTRWWGGLGHEMGHALGLPHPPGCEQNLPTCDVNALMWAGYVNYPNTYLTADEKVSLRSSPFIY